MIPPVNGMPGSAEEEIDDVRFLQPPTEKTGFPRAHPLNDDKRTLLF